MQGMRRITHADLNTQISSTRFFKGKRNMDLQRDLQDLKVIISRAFNASMDYTSSELKKTQDMLLAEGYTLSQKPPFAGEEKLKDVLQNYEKPSGKDDHRYVVTLFLDPLKQHKVQNGLVTIHYDHELADEFGCVTSVPGIARKIESGRKTKKPTYHVPGRPAP